MLSIQEQRPRLVFGLRNSNLSSPLMWLVWLTLIRGLFYLSIFPPFLGPDEPAHFEAIRLIGQEHQWPTRQRYQETPMHPEMVPVFEQYEIWALAGYTSPRSPGQNGLFIQYYPPRVAGSEVAADSYLMLYHLLLAPLSALVSSFDLVAQVYILRLVSVLFAALTVILAWVTIRAIFPNDLLLPLGACTFIVFWPMHTHVTALINVDALAELIGALFFFVLIRIYFKGLNFLRGALLSGLLLVALFTKPTLFFLFPTLISMVLISAGQRFNWPKIVTGALVGLLALASLLGAIVLYQNSAGGRNLLDLVTAPPKFPQMTDLVSREGLAFYVRSANFALVSFSGLFGWSNIHVPWAWVKVAAIIVVVLGVGVCLFVYRYLLVDGDMQQRLDQRQKEVLAGFLLAILFAFIGVNAPVIATQSPSWGVHARYYFPAIVPIALYFFIGVRQLIPVKIQRFLWPGWLMAWILYDAAIIVVVLLPYLYG